MLTRSSEKYAARPSECVKKLGERASEMEKRSCEYYARERERGKKREIEQMSVREGEERK